MSNKPVIDDKALENITTLSLLVGRFDKMQIYAMEKVDHVLLAFEIRDWRADHPGFRKDLEPFAEHYPIVEQYIQQMDQIFEKQDKYRKENDLKSVEDWWEEELSHCRWWWCCV